jgi:lysophospholipase L1-like esterase
MKHFFRNVLDFKEIDGGIAPLRFSKPQMEFFEPLPYKFRSYNAAGICLDFISDSPSFSMTYDVKLKPQTTELLYFDIFVEDKLVAFPGKEFAESGSDTWTAELPMKPGEPKRVTIYLPYLARVIIKEMKVADGAVWEPVVPYKKNLLCLGDSITQGMNAAHPSSTYAVLLSRFLGMNLLNQAVSGYVFNAETIDPSMGYSPDLITVAYGTNDWSMCESHEQFREQAAGYIHKLAEVHPQVPIFVLSPIWRSDLHEMRKAGAFTDIHQTLEQICRDLGNVRYIDGFTLVPHHTDYFADGLHPTDEGFLHMAMNLAKKMNLPAT